MCFAFFVILILFGFSTNPVEREELSLPREGLREVAVGVVRLEIGLHDADVEKLIGRVAVKGVRLKIGRLDG